MPNRSADPKILAAALRVSQTLDPGEFVRLCAQGLGEIMSPKAVHAYLPAAEGNLELRASWPDRASGASIPPAVLENRLRSAGNKRPVRGARAIQAAIPRLHGAGTEPVLILPIGESGPSRGVFVVSGGSGRSSFSAAEVASARSFLRVLQPAIDNIRLVGELRERAVRDDIAGCYNRRHFEVFLSEEIARARRFRSSVSVLFLDMDNLKGVNTAFGHAMGSRSLHEVAERIAAGIRKIDKLFRFGGDEFCIVLPETDARGAFEVGERTRKSIAAAPFLVNEVGGGGVPLSASLGAAAFPEHGITAEALVEAADRAMQSIKKAGKNATGIAEVEPADGARRPRGEPTEETV